MKRMIVASMALALTAIWGVTATANDEQIAQQIIARLQQQRQAAQLQDFNIGVQVEDGTVTMMGNVSSSEHAVLALDIARRVPGVKLVVNDLYVQEDVQPASHLAEAPPAPPAVPTAAQPTPVPAMPTPPRPAPQPRQVAQTLTAQTFAAQTVPSAPQGPPALGRPVASTPAAIQAQRQPAPQQVASQRPVPFARRTGTQRASFAAPEYAGSHPAQYSEYIGSGPSPVPMMSAGGSGYARAAYDNPQMPGYAWPSYAAYPNYAAVTYPNQYSATAWPYIGPFYPYPQVPLGWRKVMLEWDDGWWFLDFKSK